jgi:hypothetical protein
VSLLPQAVQECIDQPVWWRDELAGLHVMAALSELSLPGTLRAYRRIETARSKQWRWTESGSYLGPGAEIRRCLLLAEAEVAHTSYVGHSVLGRQVRMGAFFCCAVRNLRRGTVHLMSDGALVDTGEVTLGCVIADGTETGVRATVMPGRRIVQTPIVPPNALVLTNC